jgi:hypothetical protein
MKMENRVFSLFICIICLLFALERMELTFIMLDLDRHNLPSYFGCAICSDSFFAGGLLLIVGNVTSNGKMVSVLVLFF